MNYKPFKVDVLRKIDSTKEAWITSKSTIKYDSEEELQTTVNKMASQDLPLAAFVSFQLRIESSLLFRDLLFTIRPCIAWSSSFRINPIQDGNIFLEGDKSDYKDVESFIDSHMDGVYYQFDQGNPLDEVKLGLYLGTMTQYVITIDSRTLMCLIATLVEMDSDGLAYHISELCEVLGYSIYQELPKTSAVSLYNKLKLGDDTNYSDYTPNKDYKVSTFTRNHELFATLDVIVNASTGGQFLRQHFSLMRTNLFDTVKHKGYKECLLLECSDRFRYISCGQVENFTQLVRRRICWVCNFDWSVDDCGVESWTDIIGSLVEKMTPQEFAKMLPCRCNYKACTVSEETRLRLWQNKGVEGVIPDENPPCPILVGDPSYVQKRIDFYKSNSTIVDKWKSLVENGLIRERETKWKQENER